MCTWHAHTIYIIDIHIILFISFLCVFCFCKHFFFAMIFLKHTIWNISCNSKIVPIVRWLSEIIVTGWIKPPNFVHEFLKTYLIMFT